MGKQLVIKTSAIVCLTLVSLGLDLFSWRADAQDYGGCPTSPPVDPSPQARVYQNAELGISFSLPANYVVSEQPDAVPPVIQVMDPVSYEFSQCLKRNRVPTTFPANVSIYYLPHDGETIDLSSYVVNTVARLITDEAVAEGPRPTTFAGQPAITYSRYDPDGAAYNILVLSPDRQRLITLSTLYSYTYPDPHPADISEQKLFDQILNSFSFLTRPSSSIQLDQSVFLPQRRSTDRLTYAENVEQIQVLFNYYSQTVNANTYFLDRLSEGGIEVAAFDLNNDGQEELFGYLKGLCSGARGYCPMLVLQERGGVWTAVLDTTVSYPRPAEVTESSTQGYRDIAISLDYPDRFVQIWTFNGSVYEQTHYQDGSYRLQSLDRREAIVSASSDIYDQPLETQVRQDHKISPESVPGQIKAGTQVRIWGEINGWYMVTPAEGPAHLPFYLPASVLQVGSGQLW